MYDIFSEILAMTEEFEAYGKTWILIRDMKTMPDKSGTFYLAVEKGATTPAPVQLVFKPKATLSNDGKP